MVLALGRAAAYVTPLQEISPSSPSVTGTFDLVPLACERITDTKGPCMSSRRRRPLATLSLRAPRKELQLVLVLISLDMSWRKRLPIKHHLWPSHAGSHGRRQEPGRSRNGTTFPRSVDGGRLIVHVWLVVNNAGLGNIIAYRGYATLCSRQPATVLVVGGICRCRGQPCRHK